MTILVRDFEWDEDNLRHLEEAHPHISLADLEDIITEAGEYAKMGKDRFGKMVYAATRGNLTVLFNILPGSRVRVFTVLRR